MCGFVGLIDLRNEQRVERELLVKMTDQLVHRGPDSFGYFMDDNLGLGFRRLSIVDLETGDQPLYSEDHKVVMVCNGEIYNYAALRRLLTLKGHTFRTRSDVEVLVHLYEEEGEGLLDRLNGQYAFAIYDRKHRKLLIARDHVGVVPLYYTFADGLFIFASEVKAILKHPRVRRAVDLTGLDQVLSLPGLVSPRTMFKGIYSLRSGNYISVADSEVHVREYWDLDYPRIGEISSEKTEEYYVEELKKRLAQSSQDRLQSDVPVGVYLSGGLDSCLIAALVQQAAPEVKRDVFSVGFLDHSLDERKHQQLMAESLGALRHEIIFDWSEISERLRKMVYYSECPVKETYNTCSMALSEAVRKNGITVVLTGEGADELFGGYAGYRFDPFRARASKKCDLENALEEELRERVWGDKDLNYERDYCGFREIKAALYSEELNALLDEFDCFNFELVNKDRLLGRDPFHQRSYLDFKLRLSDHLLCDHGDRMALANSVEARFPFLGLEVIDFTRMIPTDLKLRDYCEKYILKKVAEGLVPQEIIDREKFSFHAPGSSYLLQQNIEWIADLLSYEQIKRQGYFDPDTVERLKSRYCQKGFRLALPYEDDLLMILLSFGLLLEEFNLPNLN
jgi:asparagine synthase (glutamine-hydrolysing)